MSRLFWWVLEFVGFLALNALFAKPAAKLAGKLGENAVIGWMDDRLGELFGITAPTMQQVVEWGLPALSAIAVLLALHWIQMYFYPAPVTHTSPAPEKGPVSISSTNFISQIALRLYAEVNTARRALGIRVIVAWILITICTAGLIVGIALLAIGSRQDTAMANVPNESMLSGRRVSGLEVVSRLEKLEKQHAQTVMELAAANEQLQKKQRELNEANAPTSQVEAAAEKSAQRDAAARAEVASKRPLSSYEAELKVRAIDNILKILSADMQPVVERFPLQQNWWNALKDPKNNPNFRENLISFRDEYKAACLKLDSLRNNIPEYQDLVQIIEQPNYSKNLQALEKYLVQFMYVQDTVKPDASKEALLSFMDDFMTAQYNAMNDFIGWRNSTRAKVLELRRQISS
jgi:hypothetical protein